MTAINDIFELKHKFRDFDQKLMENVYFYRLENENPGGNPQSQSLIDSWLQDVSPALHLNFPNGWITYELTARDLYDASDQVVMPVNIPGTRGTATEHLPTFLAGVVTAAVSNGIVKKGRKMIAGFLEGDQGAGLFTGPGLAVLAIRAALYGLYLWTLVGGAKKWAPVIVQRVRSGTAGNYTYRLPENAVEEVFGYITAATASGIISSQDTRKR